MWQILTSTSAPIGRECVSLVLVQLAKGDTVAAQKAFRDWGEYCEPQEVQKMPWIFKLMLLVTKIFSHNIAYKRNSYILYSIPVTLFFLRDFILHKNVR